MGRSTPEFDLRSSRLKGISRQNQLVARLFVAIRPGERDWSRCISPAQGFLRNLRNTWSGRCCPEGRSIAGAGENMMVLKICKVGNSLGLVLPQEVVSRLRTGDGQHVFLIEGPNDTYVMTSSDPAFQAKMEKSGEITARYSNALRLLAK